jgi:hypothetical protein
MLKDEPIFEWDALKDLDNRLKHGVSFREARHAFNDPNQIVLRDDSHSLSEFRYYCLGLNKEKTRVLTVRFTYRKGEIRIFGSGYWRRGRRIYEKEV